MKKYLILLLFYFSCQQNKNEVIKNVSNTSNINETYDTIKLDKQQLKIPKIIDKSIIFDDTVSYNTNIFDLKYIGQLKTKNKLPYLILSGRTCNNCDENISIFVWSPTDDIKALKLGANKYSYPGSEYDYSNNNLLFESKMFYGNCLGYESCIWIQKEIDTNEKWRKSIFIVKIINDKILEEIITDTLEINRLTKKIQCKELKGVDFTSEP